MNTPILILTQGPITWASSRYRGYWLQEAAPDVFAVHHEAAGTLPNMEDRKLVVFQKRFTADDIALARLLQGNGVKTAWDITDPLRYFEPDRTAAMIAVSDVVVCSNAPLVADVQSHFGPLVKRTAVIPDRMLPRYHPTVRDHTETDPVTLVWFGTSANRSALSSVTYLLTSLTNQGLKLRLRIIDDAPHLLLGETSSFELQHVPWTLETFHANLVDSDIALLPPFPGPWGLMKSNNKPVSAWWAGLPTVTDPATTEQEIARLAADVQERARQGRTNRAAAEAEYDIAQSVADWQALLEDLS